MKTETRTPQAWGESAWTGVESLPRRYRSIRQFTEALCEPLEVEDYVAQSMPDASPVKWHVAHTTWFFEQFVLTRFDDGYKPFHPDYAFLFNSYYNAVGDRVARPIRGLMTRPPLRDVIRYRHHVDEAVARLLARVSGPARDRVCSLIEIGLQHEQQHQELILTDVKHLLSLNQLHPAYRPRPDVPAPPDPGDMKWIGFDEGLREVGHAGDDFAYDNEHPRHRVFLDAFEIADRPVTNGEYLRFVQDGGYERPEHWLDEGWATVSANGWKAPLYWLKVDDGWKLFTLHGLEPLNLDQPVCHLSFYEAHAFAWWLGKRLPTESEWETAVQGVKIEGNFAERGIHHPVRCGGPATGGPRQAFGDVWEWTQSAYRPYPRYRAAEGALGEYNGKFMCNQFVLRGGSCCTPASHIRASYRNFFHAAARWQFSGVRLARDC